MLTMGFSDTAHEMAVWYSHIHNKVRCLLPCCRALLTRMPRCCCCAVGMQTLKEVKLNPKDVTTEFSLHMSRARFQMMYAGPVMLRNVDSGRMLCCCAAAVPRRRDAGATQRPTTA